MITFYYCNVQNILMYCASKNVHIIIIIIIMTILIII